VAFAKLNFNVELKERASKEELLNSIDELLKTESLKDAPAEVPAEGLDATEDNKEETNTQE
jgi:hypothetical protein